MLLGLHQPRRLLQTDDLHVFEHIQEVPPDHEDLWPPGLVCRIKLLGVQAGKCYQVKDVVQEGAVCEERYGAFEEDLLEGIPPPSYKCYERKM